MESESNPFVVNSNGDETILNLDAVISASINPKHSINYIKEAFKIERLNNADPKKIIASEDVLMYLEKLLCLLQRDLKKIKYNTLEEVTEVLKALRNCTSDPVTQVFISQKTDIVKILNDVFKTIVEVDSEHICLKILIQFLVNLVSSNKISAEKVHTIFCDSLLICLSHKVYIYETSALIYNISLSQQISDSGIILSLLNFYKYDQNNEFIKFYLENVVVTKDFWKTYAHLSLQQKILSLSLLRDLHHHRNIMLHEDGLNIIIDIFLNSSDTFFQTNVDSDEQKAYEAALALEILSSLSSNEKFLKKLQCCKDILIQAGLLLINIHRLGKETQNCFTPVQKLSEFSEESDLQNHPAYGFKADLIRLIGNMCWKSTEIQNLTRIAELIPVILESTNMDARNPFILQWCILAIRNLCDGNSENQRFIASLHRQGTVSAEVLTEMGLTLHTDGENQIKVISLDSLQN